MTLHLLWFAQVCLVTIIMLTSIQRWHSTDGVEQYFFIQPRSQWWTISPNHFPQHFSSLPCSLITPGIFTLCGNMTHFKLACGWSTCACAQVHARGQNSISQKKATSLSNQFFSSWSCDKSKIIIHLKWDLHFNKCTQYHITSVLRIIQAPYKCSKVCSWL